MQFFNKEIFYMISNNQKSLTVFKLVMMAVVAIDSLKNLPSNAQYGSSLIYFYLIAMCVFFIPSALVCAELATSFPKTGGAYIWIREAFGKPTAFMAAWIQWLIAITWSPTILSFMMASLFYLFYPTLAENKVVMLGAILVIFWGGLFLISHGIKLSSRISALSAIIGVILPMFCISILGIAWLVQGNLIQIDLTFRNANLNINANNLRLFIPLLYSLMGIEMIAVHAGDVHNPQKNYPLVLFIASLLIVGTVIPASLSIAIVIPNEQISLTTGVIASFSNFLTAFKLTFLLPVVVIALTIGSFGIFYSWLLSVSRYLLTAAQDGSLPNFLQTTNKHLMPVNQLLLQGVSFTIISTILIIMPSVNHAFWLLTASCSQFALLYYILLFSAAIHLRYKKPKLLRPFQVGKSPFLITVLSSVAITTCLAVIIFGFIPPPGIQGADIFRYEVVLTLFMFGGLGTGITIYFFSQLTNQRELAAHTELRSDIG